MMYRTADVQLYLNTIIDIVAKCNNKALQVMSDMYVSEDLSK